MTENEEPTPDESEPTPTQTTDKDLLVPNTVVKNKKFSITIEPLVLGIFLAECLAETVTTNLIVSRTCEIHFKLNKSVCEALEKQKINQTDIETLVQPYTAVIITGMTFLSVFLPAIMSFFVGPWSDYNGRKLVFVLPAIGYFIKYIFLIIFSFFTNLSPSLALISALPIALSGGMVNFIFASYTYISDVASESEQSTRIGILEAFMTAGSVIGLLSAAPVRNAGGDYGIVIVYSLCACVVLLVTTFTCFFVPDSIQRSESGKGFLQVFQTKLFKEMLEVCFKKRGDSNRGVIFLVIITLTISISAMVGEANVMYLFLRLRFGWNLDKYTIWSSITLTFNFIGVLLGILLFIKILKIPDPVIGIMAYALKCGSALYIALLPSTKSKLIYFVGLINLFGGLCGPIARSVLSKSIPKEHLGKVFALLSSSEAIFPLGIGPLYTAIYNATIHILPNAFLFFSTGLFLICLMFFIIIYFIHSPKDQTQYNQLENEIE